MTKPPEDEDFTAEVTGYVTPAMKDELNTMAKKKGFSVSQVVRFALATWLKDQKR